MPLDAQLDALARIYHVLSDTLENKALACHRGCSPCCTQNVAMTTLEGYQIITHLDQPQKADLLDRLSALADTPARLPKSSINELARQCTDHTAVSEKEDTKGGGRCPLLQGDICTIYAVRPLACRMMVSTKDCRMTGFARMDPFFLSAGNVFMEFTEHIDSNGWTGNLVDVLSYLLIEKNRHSYETGTINKGSSRMLSNHPLTVLMVPPEHRRQITPILQMLNPAIGDI
jgi:Fe-S-cluster containining protein